MKPSSKFFLSGLLFVCVCIFIGLAIRVFFPKTTLIPSLSNQEVLTLQSFYQNPAEYDQAFAEAVASQSSVAYAAVTSHHFLAKSVIARTLTGIDPTNIKTIILISPDHFDNITDNSLLGVTTNAKWATPYGEMTVNIAQQEALLASNPLRLQDRSFLNEHGIYTIVPFLKKQFPDASLIPIVLRQSDQYQQYESLGKALHTVFDPTETLVVISSDFSHNKPSDQAVKDDQQSILTLAKQDLQTINQIDSDCKVCMATLFGYLQTLPHTFQLVENTDSFKISGQDEHTVTSYVSARFIPLGATPLPPIKSVTLPSPSSQSSSHQEAIRLLFGGDLMFDRTIRQKMNQAGHAFILQELVPLFESHTAVIANLEGPVTNNASKSVGSIPGSPANFIFTFDPMVATTLYDQKLRVVNLGNNHIQNFGQDGVVQTKKYLTDANVHFFGDTGSETNSNERSLILEFSGVKIGFVNYNQFTADGFVHALTDIEAVRPQVDLLIMYTHWGNEYVPTANEVITNQAHRFVDQGVDIVIGSHPHVVQNQEDYKGKRIYYSLGNMVFDQYFRPEVQKGLLVTVEVDPQTLGLSFQEHAIQLKTSGQTVLAPTATP